ncbi:putative E3 ubiquitin-protein ligase MARCH [Helianthus annuus]|nr:putative E3 ubiquitin-protein ligase MARCH [Helianthus annuus]KAJ0578196.1 putative E3 ubiquitin-protein ligase MARCH [Helianthus annuus]KAJ0748265.1 putative E3 ubiquitin-protein ligase MARCH [Helianthus annuus]KAJ0790029.1 putative E3 ubiquitin-protein ligase MARCH [Helianthus annuus]
MFTFTDNNIYISTTTDFKLDHFSKGVILQMEDERILRGDRPVVPLEGGNSGFVTKGCCSQTGGLTTDSKVVEECNVSSEEEPLIQSIECRICQEEDSVKNLEVPCACSGSLKFAHRKCVQRWCDEKRDIICEICHQPYKPGYTAPPPQPDDTIINISGNWTLSGTPLDLNDPRVLALAAAEQRFIESDYDEYEDNGASGASLCRSVAIILMALLLLRHALTIGDGDSDDDDPSVFFAIFLLRAAGFLLPCYIMIWAISILQRRRQAQEVETLAAADVAFMIQAGQHRGLQVTIAPGTVVAPSPAVTPPVIAVHDPLH